jgi:hypothetical protein
LTTLAAACALALPALAHSRQVTLTAQLKNYGGDGAYLAAYLTDAKGAYVRTLVGGRRQGQVLQTPVRLEPPVGR